MWRLYPFLHLSFRDVVLTQAGKIPKGGEAVFDTHLKTIEYEININSTNKKCSTDQYEHYEIDRCSKE